MAEFGDYEDDDAYDPTAEADPEQVARKIRQFEGGDWEELTQAQRTVRISIALRILGWLRRSGHLR